MSSSELVLKQSSSLPVVLEQVQGRSRHGFKLEHHEPKEMRLEAWSLKWQSAVEHVVRPSVGFMTMLVALSLVCASVMGFWGIFVLPVLFLVWRALNPAHYEHRLVLYHDGFSFVRGTHMFFKPHVQEEHAWHEVKVVEIRSMPSDIRARVDRLEADHHRHVSAAKHAEEPENRVKYEQQAADVRKMIDQVWQDFYRKMPVLGREQILASQASDREACFHGRIMVSIQEESLGWMTKSLALTILDVFETMMGKRDGVLALGYEQTVEPSEPDNDW